MVKREKNQDAESGESNFKGMVVKCLRFRDWNLPCNLKLVCVEFESTYLCTFIFDSSINVHGC